MAKVSTFTIFFSVLISFCVETCFIPKSVKVVVPQTIPAGFQVAKVEAVDCEPGSLRLSSTDPSFTVQSNGVLVSVSPVSVETGERTFSVIVQDDNGPGSEMEVHLVCEKTLKGNQIGQVVLKRTKRRWGLPPFNIRENEKGPFPRLIERVGSDSAQNYSVYYTLSGPGADLFPFNIFSLNDRTGDLYVHNSVDREVYPKFILKVGALDRVTNQPRDLPMNIEVIVDDENDNAPQFIDPLQFTVAEQRSVGTAVAKLSSIDRDAPETDHVRVRYKLLSGSDFFAINPETGVISTVTNTLDRETKDKHMVIVEVRDMKGAPNGLFSTATATINLSDINDNPPTFTQPSYKATIPENVGEKLLLRIPVEDKDLINTPNWISKFVITKGNENGNFRIDTDPKTNDGLLYVTKPLDYEQNSTVKLEVSARNLAELNGTTAQWQSVPVDVAVTDIDEGPEFTVPIVRIPIKENTPNGTEIGTYKAIDPETKKSDGITYYKTSDPGLWVSLDRNTGQLRVANTIDRESPLVQNGMYNISVKAVDPTSKSGTGTVILVIEDVNDNQPKIPSELVMCEATEDQFSSVVVVAEDKDTSLNSFPFTFQVGPGFEDTWSVQKYNDTAATLTPLKALPRGIYDIPVIAKDLQGYGETQNLKVTICQCRNGVCAPKQSSVSLGPLGILALLLPLALLLLLLLLLAFFCITKREKVELDDMGYGAGILLPSNTEAPGDEVDSNLINGLSMGVDQKSLKGSMKGSILNSGWVGNKSFSTIGGHSMYDMGVMQPGISVTNVQNYSSTQFDDYGAQLVGSQLLGNGMDYKQSNLDYTLPRTWNTNRAYLLQKIANVETEGDDIIHSYDYEGNGSVASSVGCCSDYNDSETLDFLNTLGPKFKTLADVCTKS